MKTYTLLDRNGKPYESSTKGLLGGHRKQRMYGRLDCPSALRWIAKGYYVKERVFFADEATAIAAGYHPCKICMNPQKQGGRVTPALDSSDAYDRAEELGLRLLEHEVASSSELARNVGMLLLRIGDAGGSDSTAQELFESRRERLQDQLATVIESQPDLDPVVGMRVLFEMALLFVEQIHDQVDG